MQGSHVLKIVVFTRMQTRWRSKLAKKELRKRRAEARESGKLLQDKQALEHRLKEMQAILETVQNQRNELKQLYKVRHPTYTLQPSASGKALLPLLLLAQQQEKRGSPAGRTMSKIPISCCTSQ